MGKHIEKLQELLAKPQRIFLILSAILGIIYVFLNPPMRSPDEHYHFLRAYEISKGGIMGGVMYPQEVLDFAVGLHKRNFELFKGNKATVYGIGEIGELSKIKDAGKEVYVEGNPRTTIYSPVPYLPAAIGIFAANLIGVPALVMLYFARITTLVASTVLLYYAIKITPRFKYVMLFLALTPVSIMLKSSVSADAITTSLSFLFVAVLLDLMDNKKGAGNRDFYILCGISLSLLLCKIAYVLLPSLVLLVPKERLANARKAIVIFPAIIISTAWSLWAKAKFLSGKTLIGANFIPEDLFASDKRWPEGQIRYVLEEPLALVKAFFNSVDNEWVQYALHSFFSGLGYVDIWIPFPFVLLQILLLIVLVSAEEIRLKLWQRFLCVGVFLATFVIMAFLIYVQWNPYKYDIIAGLQGRYFYPIILPLLLACTPAKAVLHSTKRNMMVLALLTIILLGFVLSVLAILNHDYGVF